LSFPTEFAPDTTNADLLKVEFDCSSGLEDIRNFIKNVQAQKSAEEEKKRTLKYPQNILRNVARANCQNSWITCPDVDMVFPRPGLESPSMYQRLNNFLRQPEIENCTNCAFVFPLYEIQSDDHVVPANKKELLQLVANNSARQYHVQVGCFFVIAG